MAKMPFASSRYSGVKESLRCSPSYIDSSQRRTTFKRRMPTPAEHTMTTKQDLNDTDRQTRRMSTNTPVASSSLPWRANNRGHRSADYSTGSPHKMTTPRRHGNSIPLARTPQFTNGFQRRDSMASQYTPSSRNSSGRWSFSSSFRAAVIPEEPNMTSSMVGIPEVQAVQEMAFRQGQRDRGVLGDQVPSSPFAERYNKVWEEYYKLGKILGGEPASAPTTPMSAHPNFLWPVLINPYTQDIGHPTGSIDAQWARKICIIALNCMDALIRVVCRRQSDWEKITCDVPAPVKQALEAFPDLHHRYEILKHAAQEACAGGRPFGY